MSPFVTSCYGVYEKTEYVAVQKGNNAGLPPTLDRQRVAVVSHSPQTMETLKKNYLPEDGEGQVHLGGSMSTGYVRVG